MKPFIGCAAILALISAAPAFAAKNSENITLAHPVTVGSTQLPAAEYKVTWNEASANAQVTLTHGKSIVTLPAKVVEQKHVGTSVRTKSVNGSNILQGLDLSKVSVDFTSSPNSGQ